MIKQLLPTQKGTEVYPQQTRIPARVRITNTGDPALLQRAYDRVSPYVQNFYARCAREYSLGILRVARRQVSVPGAEITYRNNYGEEIVSVTLSPELIKPDDEKSPTLLLIRVFWRGVAFSFEDEHRAQNSILATSAVLGDSAYIISPNTPTYAGMGLADEFLFQADATLDSGQRVDLIFVDLRQVARYFGDFTPFSLYLWEWWGTYPTTPSGNPVSADMRISVEAYGGIDTDGFWDAIRQNPDDYPSKYQTSAAWYAYMVAQMEGTGEMQVGQQLSVDDRNHFLRIWTPDPDEYVSQSDFIGMRFDISTGSALASPTSIRTTYKGPFQTYDGLDKF